MAGKAWHYWAAAGFAASLVAGWIVSERYEAARQAEDGETIECLMQRLSPEEKYRLTKLSEQDDYRPLWLAYSEVFPRCALHASQWERKRQLMFVAWSLMKIKSREF
ncbi:hypothetical protein [Cupriavidus sp. H39]|uniref:hypothetical protein n=1 Tax=Cupriavidus sp. H39 TaxID=3401635 RepID=UPI003CFEC7B9